MASAKLGEIRTLAAHITSHAVATNPALVDLNKFKPHSFHLKIYATLRSFTCQDSDVTTSRLFGDLRQSLHGWLGGDYPHHGNPRNQQADV